MLIVNTYIYCDGFSLYFGSKALPMKGVRKLHLNTNTLQFAYELLNNDKLKRCIRLKLSPEPHDVHLIASTCPTAICATNCFVFGKKDKAIILGFLPYA